MLSDYRSRALANAPAPKSAARSRRRAATVLAASVAAAFGLGQSNARGATFVWDGGVNGAGTTWLSAANWNPDTANDTGPGVNDLAQFTTAGPIVTIGVNPNNTTNNGTANQAIGQILLSSGINRTINNNGTAVDGVLTLNGIAGVMLSNTTTNGTLTLANGGTRNLGVVLGTSGEFNVANSGAAISITSVVSETGGPRSLSKTGAGTLTLNGANTYTGAVAVDNGLLNINTLTNTGANQSLGTGTGTVSIGSASTAGMITYTGAATTTNRNFSAGSAGGTLSHANNITYTGTISGTGPFFKAGNGTLIVNGAGFISGSSINIAGGTLRLDNATTNSNDRLDNSTSIGMFGGTLQFDGNRDIPTTEVASQLFAGSNGNTIRTTVTAGSASNASISFAGLSKGTGATLAFDIASGVDVNFASSTLADGIIGGWALAGSDFATVDINTGNVVPYASTVSNDPALWGSTQNVKVNANATLAGAGIVNSVQLADNAGAPVTLTLNGQLNLKSGGLIASAVSGHTIDGSGSLTAVGNELYLHVPTAGHVLNVNVAVADNGTNNVDLITTGPGTTILNAANTFQGIAQINSGTLQMGAAGTLTNNTVNVTAAGTFSVNGQTKTIGGLTGSGPATLGTNGSLSIGNNNSSTTYAGIISGSGDVTKIGTGTLTLRGVNTFTGNVNVGNPNGIGAGGVLVVDADSRFGNTATKVNLYNGTLRLVAGAGVTTLVTSVPVGTPGLLLQPGRNFTLNAGNGLIDVPTGNYAEIAGLVSDGTGGPASTSPLHKIGGGVLDMRTGNHTFTGGVIIDGGTYGVNKDANFGALPGAFDDDAVQLNNGATIKWYSSGAGPQAGMLANRGLKIGAGGGILDYSLSSGVPLLNNKITSAVGNTLTKIGTNTLQSNITQDLMNGDLLVNQGRWNTHANGAAGNGTIFLNAPDLPNTPGGTGVAQLGIGGANLGLTVTLTNNIVLNPTGQGLASFEVNISTPVQNELILNGVISGTGGLQKGRVAGTNGILTIGGANTYTGDTTILFGTLRTKGGAAIPDNSAVVLGNPSAANSANLEIVDSETVGGLSGGGPSTGNVQIASGQTLSVNQGTDATYAGVISGASGNLAVSGAGVLTLTGVNTYTGNTAINGTIAAGAATALGDVNNTITSGGGRLRATASWSSPDRNVTINANGFRVDTNGFDVALGTVTSDGTGGLLRKESAGTLTVKHVRTAALDVQAGTLAMVSDSTAAGVSKVNTVTIGASARLDLKANKLLTNSPIGTFTGGAYTGVQGEVARAYNFGAWDMPGLMTSEPNAGPLIGTTTIGVADGATVLFLGPAETGTFAGQTVSGDTTLAVYTYAGDLNFDGLVDAADYGVIDNWVQFPGTTGYANGDFNYDGVIDAGDYGIIDNTIQLQGAPIPMNGAVSDAGLSGVTAVPEPASLSVIAIAAAAGLLGRRRRRVH